MVISILLLLLAVFLILLDQMSQAEAFLIDIGQALSVAGW